jgi:hydrogenase maturation protease
MQILCCGNRHRGDDAAGLLVADRLREWGIAAEILDGEATEIMEAWDGADSAVLVDAVVTGKRPGTVHAWDGGNLKACSTSSASSHGLGVGEAIELARALGRLPSKIRIYGIEGRQFTAGAGVSPEVEAAVEVVARAIAQVAGADPATVASRQPTE